MAQFQFSTDTVGHFVGGSWSYSGGVRESFNPATDAVLGRFHDADLEVSQAAITAARECFDTTTWSKDRELRARTLREMADAIERTSDDLISAITLENGKIRAEAGFEIGLCAPRLRYYAALALTDLGHAAEVRDGVVSMLLKEPVGVAGVIAPWNAAAFLAIRSIAPALAAGCTAAVKMPAQTALTNALVARVLCSVPSLPPGVLNFFTESGDTGAKELVSSPLTDVVSYTGSTAVGASIMAAAAPLLKRVSLELGGKTPMIVFDDADLDAVIPTLAAGVTTFAGQFCMAGSRILVQAGIADEVETRLAKALENVNVAPASDPASEMGPMIDNSCVRRMEGILDGVADADFIVRGGAISGAGAFFKPVLVSVEELQSPLIQEELFGPIATFEVFTDEADAIARANATQYGLAASVWTADGGRSLRMSSAIKAGTVWTNTWGQVLDQFEEGGYKRSGVGRLNGTGGLAEFQEAKHVVRTAN